MCRQLVERGSDNFYFHPEGKGCFVPPPQGEDPRRVLIKVMTHKQVSNLARQKFTEHELAEFRARFDAHDKDGGGTICAEELAYVIRELGQEVNPAKLKATIGAVDADGDGEIDFDEFMQMELLMEAGLIAAREQLLLEQEEASLDWRTY